MGKGIGGRDNDGDKCFYFVLYKITAKLTGCYPVVLWSWRLVSNLLDDGRKCILTCSFRFFFLDFLLNEIVSHGDGILCATYRYDSVTGAWRECALFGYVDRSSGFLLNFYQATATGTCTKRSKNKLSKKKKIERS